MTTNPQLTGTERVDCFIETVIPVLKTYPNGRLIAELSLHAADESLRAVEAVCSRGDTVLSDEALTALFMCALKAAEYTIRANFERVAQEI